MTTQLMFNGDQQAFSFRDLMFTSFAKKCRRKGIVLTTFYYLCSCKGNKMNRLNLPSYATKIMSRDGKPMIFDSLRRKYVSLTPEEWVRQHFIHYLTEHLGYPSSMLANEVELLIGSKRLRCDSVLYGHGAEPRMIIEYKAPTVALTQKVFDQISTYNMLLHVDYLVVSNGLSHYCCKMDYENQKYLFLESIPKYENIKQS